MRTIEVRKRDVVIRGDDGSAEDVWLFSGSNDPEMAREIRRWNHRLLCSQEVKLIKPVVEKPGCERRSP